MKLDKKLAITFTLSTKKRLMLLCGDYSFHKKENLKDGTIVWGCCLLKNKG
jgi:hypothetical protein